MGFSDNFMAIFHGDLLGLFMVMWKIQRHFSPLGFHGNDDLPWGEHRKKDVGNPWFPGNAEEVIP